MYSDAFHSLASGYIFSSFPEPHRRNLVSIRTYKAYFKLSPIGTARLWQKLQDCCQGSEYADTSNGNSVLFCRILPVQLLWTLHYMKTDTSESVCSAFFGISRKTLRKYFWAIVFFLEELAYSKVRFFNMKYCIFLND
jgi:hypothetical protein